MIEYFRTKSGKRLFAERRATPSGHHRFADEVWEVTHDQGDSQTTLCWVMRIKGGWSVWQDGRRTSNWYMHKFQAWDWITERL